MEKQKITQTIQECLGYLSSNSIEEALNSLKPILEQKISFSLLDHAGRTLGKHMSTKKSELFTFLDKIEATKAMGGYVINASALSWLLDHDLAQAMSKAKEYTVKGDTWYVADIIGERVPGQALVGHFNKTLPILEAFLADSNPWVKRSAGVAVHYHTKRVKNEPEKAEKLLRMLSPYFEERDIRVVKGIGWGLKTLGRYYPQLVVDFLKSQKGKKPSALLMKKALTYLTDGQKAEVKAIWG